MRKILAIAAFGVLTFAVSTTAAAQAAEPRNDGFNISFGFGGGSATYTCDGCPKEPRQTGGTGYLRIGGAVSPTLVISGESNAWVQQVNGADVSMGSLMAVAQWYPSATNGFFLKGGAGFGVYTEETALEKYEAVGPAVQVGLGYDVGLGKRFSLTPYLNFVGMGKSEVKMNSTATGLKIATDNVQYGLGFTWH